jgi:hypothetical protein
MTFLSELPEAKRVPFAQNASDLTDLKWPFKTSGSVEDSMSHSLTVLSTLPEASTLPSGEKATAITLSVCPERVLNGFAVPTDHRITVLSVLPEATSSVFNGEKATEETAPVWFLRQSTCLSACQSHNLTVESAPPDTK